MQKWLKNVCDTFQNYYEPDFDSIFFCDELRYETLNNDSVKFAIWMYYDSKGQKKKKWYILLGNMVAEFKAIHITLVEAVWSLNAGGGGSEYCWSGEFPLMETV